MIEELHKRQMEIIEKLLQQRKAFYDLMEFGPFGIEYSKDMLPELDNDWQEFEGPSTKTLRQRILQIDGVHGMAEMVNPGEDKVCRIFVVKGTGRNSL